jgi:hypothetical protein
VIGIISRFTGIPWQVKHVANTPLLSRVHTPFHFSKMLSFVAKANVFRKCTLKNLAKESAFFGYGPTWKVPFPAKVMAGIGSQAARRRRQPALRPAPPKSPLRKRK